MFSVPKELVARTVLSHTLFGCSKRSLPYSLALGLMHSFVATLGQDTTYKLSPHFRDDDGDGGAGVQAAREDIYFGARPKSLCRSQSKQSSAAANAKPT